MITKAPAASFDSAFKAADGRPSGFDYLRIILALAVYGVHVVGTTYGTQVVAGVWETGIGPVVRAIMPMFFALSGFLVAGSMLRCATIVKFMGLRVLRIYPALAVEVLLSALLIGPLMTTYPLAAYFSDPVFWRYMVNITGHISFFLPGVFADNPVPHYVNRQLWTVPWELCCYVALGALMMIGAAKRRILLPLGVVACLAYFAVPMLVRRGVVYENADVLQGQLLVVAFLIGVTLYLYRERMPSNRPWGIGSAILSYWLLSMPFNGATFLATLPIAYFTVWLGLLNPRRVSIVRHADYSYGVFLYGAIIQQMLMAFPPLREWYWNIGIGLPLTILVAALSWHLVEKPCQNFKGRLNDLEHWWLGLWNRATGRFASVPVAPASER